MGQVILFDDFWLKGNHKHVVGDQPDLAASDDSSFNDKTLSFVILSGNWQFFRGVNFQTPYAAGDVLGPGVYELGYPVNATPATLSSLRQTTLAATTHGDVPSGQVTLFGNANFHGDHRHLFTDSYQLPGFDNVTSSFVIDRFGVAKPTVRLYSDPGGGHPYAHLLGTGAYAWVGDYGLPNDDLSALTMTAGPGEPSGIVHGDQSFGHAILFEHEQFHGRHKHVYLGEADLGAADDVGFAAITSSLFIERGAWATCRQTNYQGFMPNWDMSGYGQTPSGPGFTWGQLQAPPYHLPGAYPSVTAIGIDNDAIRSIHLPVPDIWLSDVGAFSQGGQTGHELWHIFVTGPHAPGAVTMKAYGFTYTDQTNIGWLKEIGSYKDPATGLALAHAYALCLEIPDGIQDVIEVDAQTEGAYGSTLKSNGAAWRTQPPPPPPPPATTVVPNVVGMLLSDAIPVLDNARLRNNEIDPAGVVQTNQIRITGQTPAAGNRVALNTTVDLAVVAATTAPTGCSEVRCWNENTASTAYEVWTYTAGSWKDQGKAPSLYDPESNSIPTNATPFSVTLTDGQTSLVGAFPLGSDPASTQAQAWNVYHGQSDGPAVNFQFQ